MSSEHNPEPYVRLAQYNAWMNQKLYAASRRIDDERRRRDLGAFFGSVHLTLTHLLITDRAWLARLRSDKSEFVFLGNDGQTITVTGLVQDLYPDFADLERERVATDRCLLEFANGLTAEFLRAPIRYRTSSGEPAEHPAWWAVSHLFNHQTHHRGQVTTLLHQLGHDPGVTDFVAFLREWASQTA